MTKTVVNKFKSRPKKSLRNRYSILLDAIWRSLGGPAFVANTFETPFQNVINWRIRGKVPLEKVGAVARQFNIPEWGLNYEELRSLKGEAPSWKQVVKSYKFSPKIEERLLKLDKDL